LETDRFRIKGNASDYFAIGNVYDGSFQLGYLKHYIKAVDEGVYNRYRDFLERINQDDIMP
jgi:hypothetical protein